MVTNTRILIVDDDPDQRRTLEWTLTQAGYNVSAAVPGADALRLICREQPALVLLDTDLNNGTSGVEVCQAIKADPALARCYVVLMSDYHTNSDIRADDVDSGADGFIVRPISNRELGARIEAMLRIRRAEVTLRLHEELERQLEEACVAKQRELQECELRSYDEISANQHTLVTAQMLGPQPLREADAHTFETLVSSYSQVLEHALEQRVFQVDHDISETLRAISEHLGEMGAGPRDVIDIHSVALERKTKNVSAERLQAYFQEGRLTSLELMGYLVKYYRARAVNSSPHFVDPDD